MYVANITNGGLGNILFQLLAGYSYAKETNKQYIISEQLNQSSGHEHISCYFSNLLKNFTLQSITNDYAVYKEQGFNYNPIPNIDDDIMLAGYFQSYKYFQKYRQEIIQLLDIPQKQENVCSIHIRRGDYLKLQKYHTVQDLDYYNRAMEIIKADKYLVFSDDIEWCRQNFIGEEFEFYNESPYKDLIMMSRCKDNIVANSTFSWWGAWLNNNPNKKVIMPKNWFGPRYNYSIDDLVFDGATVI